MDYSFSLNLYPGKASPDGSDWLPFWMHSMDTAEIMLRLIDNWLPKHIKTLDILPEEETQKLCRFLALVHDIGKLTPIFATRILNDLPEIRQKLEVSGLRIGSLRDYPSSGYSPHAKAGEAILLNLHCPSGIAAVAGAHHGKPQVSRIECEEDPEVHWQNYYADSSSQHLWGELHREWFHFALRQTGYESPEALPEISQPAQILLTGLLIMSDWLASNTDYFPLIPIDSCGTEDDYPARADRAWDILCLPETWNPMRYVMDADRFSAVFGFPPNAVQSMMIQAVNGTEGGIYILEAQMGIGKTEAALAAAEVLASKSGSGGIFFGLPTQATANGIFSRLTDWARKQSEETQQSIRLAHGMAELNEDYRALFHGSANGNEDGEREDGLIVHPWFHGHKQALLADYVIGTVDQLLMMALKQKHVMLRHLGLAGKVVILDECHAYDAYMNQYLDRALNWLGEYQIPVIILSATLPELRREALIEAYLNGTPDKESSRWRTERAYPLLTWTSGREVRQTSIESDSVSRTVEIQSLDSSDWLSPLQTTVSAGGCCGVIVNTVRKAQELAQMAAAAMPHAEIILLHSRFTAADRARIESDLQKRAGKRSSPEDRAGLIVIGTQVLEQSLDIDFDLLITQLCPMDLLLQRLGRLHRHTRPRPKLLTTASCYILDLNKEDDEGSRAIYGDWLLMRTRELLPEEICLPQSIPQLVQDTYGAPDEHLLRDTKHQTAWEGYENMLKGKKARAANYRIEPPQRSISRRARTIDGWLNVSFPADAFRGESAVRDGEAGITVLAMQEQEDGRISFFPWQNENKSLSATHVPDDETARRIVRQRLQLPRSFSIFERADATIRALEALNRQKLPEWQNSVWLSGELILLFDVDYCAHLCGERLRYTREFGLILERKDDGDDANLQPGGQPMDTGD